MVEGSSEGEIKLPDFAFGNIPFGPKTLAKSQIPDRASVVQMNFSNGGSPPFLIYSRMSFVTRIAPDSVAIG